METPTARDDGSTEVVDRQHIVGDIYWIDRYGSGWWMAGVIVSLGAFPVGVVMLFYMTLQSLCREDDIPEVYPRD